MPSNASLLLVLASLFSSCAVSVEEIISLEEEPVLLVIERGVPTLSSVGTLTSTEQISLAGAGDHFALSPSGALGAACLNKERRIQLIDLSKMRRAEQVELGYGKSPADVEFIDNERLLIGSYSDGAISLFDRAFGHAHQDLDSGGQSATELVIDLDTETFWVLDPISGMVARMSWVRSAVQRSRHLAEDLRCLFYNEREGEVWALSSGPGRIFVLDARDLSLLRELKCAEAPSGVVFDSAGDAWVAHESANEILKLDPLTGDVKSRVILPLGESQEPPRPNQLLIDEERSLIHVVCPGSGSIQIIDMELERCVASVDELRSPAALTKSPLALR